MIFATSGAKFYIGGPVPLRDRSLTEADFVDQSDLWVEVVRHENLGSIGGSSAELEVKSGSHGEAKVLKGTRSANKMELICTLDYEDLGQVAIVAAERSHSNFAFRLVFNDASEGGTPSERLFIAVVGGVDEQLDDADFVPKMNASLWLNSNVVRINAAPGGGL